MLAKQIDEHFRQMEINICQVTSSETVVLPDNDRFSWCSRLCCLQQLQYDVYVYYCPANITHLVTAATLVAIEHLTTQNTC